MNIIGFGLAVLTVLVLLVSNEIYWRKTKRHGELSRKFIHITVGSFVATWPFFMSWGQILFLSLAFLVVISISKYFHVFQSIHSVQRPTHGELFFAAAVGLTALITQDKYIFAAAVLHMSLADGLAAVIGTKYGRTSQYKVFGHAKSLAGSATFLLISIGIIGVYGLVAGVTYDPLSILAIAFVAAVIENVGLYGVDNLLVPLLIAYALNL